MGFEHIRTSAFLVKKNLGILQNLRPPMLEWAVISEVQSAQTLGRRVQTCLSVWKISDCSFSKAHLRWVLSSCLCRGDGFVLDSGLRSLFSALPSPVVGPSCIQLGLAQSDTGEGSSSFQRSQFCSPHTKIPFLGKPSTVRQHQC